MDDAELLQIEPPQLTFLFEWKKQISCSLHLANKSTNHVAFKVKTSAPKSFSVRPNRGIITPQGTCDVTVTMQAQRTAPLDFRCNDKFLIQSAIAPVGASLDDIFLKNSDKHFEKKKLGIVLLPPNEDLSPAPALTTEPNDASQLMSLAKDVKELKKEVEKLKSKLSAMDLQQRADLTNSHNKEPKQLMKNSEVKDVLTKTLGFCKRVLFWDDKNAGYSQLKTE